MPKFIMLIGLPAAGKDVWACEHANENTVVCSSDDIRAELYGDAAIQENHNKVFGIMLSRSREALRGGKDVIYNATNIKHKHRAAILREVKKIDGVVCEAVVIVSPIEVLKERNAARERVVPEYVIDRMARSFQMPVEEEGFDSIQIVNYGMEFAIRANVFTDLKDFGSQKNPNHSLSLFDHCADASILADQRGYEKSIVDAAFIHDVGKIYTQIFDDQGIAHYHGHAEYGSWLAVSMGFSVEVAQLVCYHMKPYAKQEAEAWKKRLGEELWSKIEQLHECDVAAH